MTKTIGTSAFDFELDCEKELKALRGRNHLGGTSLDLGGGPELEVEVDAAKARSVTERTT